ncbi:MAG: AAA family ATPase [Eubacteriales bacterium]|nr:AAA family ATPase [Eubacteriales bacterium]
MKKPLPIGVENFEDIIRNGYYYVDKTLFIKELLDWKGRANLFTRPRRFGKTLSLSMLRYFFENTGNTEQNEKNAQLFQGMKIMETGEVYTSQMGQFPVINLTLKSGKQQDFAGAYYQLREEIKWEFARHSWVLENLRESDRKSYQEIMDGEAEKEAYYTSLKFLSNCLYQVTGKKTIILIDEYDVPLENAYFQGFYGEMIGFIRSLFESALKTNDALEFAVITGCLRISKESIFTGLNHLNIISILDKQYSEYFGFTRAEVKEMMAYYEREERYEDMKLWYDGYSFGDTDIYNPWSVIKFLYDLRADRNAFPRAYWVNTSSNDIIRTLVGRADRETKAQIEDLLAGGTMEIQIQEEITYGDIEESMENLWNFLYFTGYLTKCGERFENRSIYLKVVIPNEELKSVYDNIILTWFKESVRKENFQDFYRAMEDGDTQKMTEILNKQLQATISFYDSAENFYHGFMAGILSQSQDYIVKSNRESGTGRNDLMVYSPDIEGRSFVLELKAAPKFRQLDAVCEEALTQIEEKHYTEYLEEIGYENITCYGIGFFRKNCRVKKKGV